LPDFLQRFQAEDLIVRSVKKIQIDAIMSLPTENPSQMLCENVWQFFAQNPMVFMMFEDLFVLDRTLTHPLHSLVPMASQTCSRISALWLPNSIDDCIDTRTLARMASTIHASARRGDNCAWLFLLIEAVYDNQIWPAQAMQTIVEPLEAAYQCMVGPCEPFWPNLRDQLAAAPSYAAQMNLLDECIVQANCRANERSIGPLRTLSLDWTASHRQGSQVRILKCALMVLHLKLGCDTPILEALWLSGCIAGSPARLTRTQLEDQGERPHRLALTAKAARKSAPTIRRWDRIFI
jgi:hypothetical protein